MQTFQRQAETVKDESLGHQTAPARVHVNCHPHFVPIQPRMRCTSPLLRNLHSA
jgi:hypothetical protein